MKKFLMILILGFSTTFAAGEGRLKEVQDVIQSKEDASKPSFFYLRFAAAEGDVALEQHL